MTIAIKSEDIYVCKIDISIQMTVRSFIVAVLISGLIEFEPDSFRVSRKFVMSNMGEFLNICRIVF